MAVEVEYPLPGALLGPAFHAGGEYDPTRTLLPTKASSVYIICKLADSGGEFATSTQSDDLSAAIGPTFWDVEFTSVPTGHPNCELRAYLVVDNGTPQLQETVQNLNAGNADAGGDVIITEIP